MCTTAPSSMKSAPANVEVPVPETYTSPATESSSAGEEVPMPI